MKKKNKRPSNVLNKGIPKQDEFEVWYDKMASKLNEGRTPRTLPKIRTDIISLLNKSVNYGDDPDTTPKLDLMFAPKDLLDYIQSPSLDCDFDGAKYNSYEIEENKIK